MKYLYVAVSLAMTFYAQIMMKWRATAHAPSAAGRKLDYLIAMYTDIGVLSVFGAAALAGVAWSLAIQQMPLTTAYPFMALSFAIVPLASVILFRESLAPLQVMGIFFIVVGVGLSAAAK